MTDRRMWHRWIVGVVVAGMLAPGVACGGSAAEVKAPAPAAERQTAPKAAQDAAPKVDVAFDHALTDTARVLAGMPPEDSVRLANVLKRPEWQTHRTEFSTNWNRVSEQRFRLMRDWREQEFGPLASSCETLFYPFGGPDFLNAYVLFPHCSRYLLFGLEPVGRLPVFDRMDDARIDAVLVQIRESLSDIFLRDYFITKTMMTELQTPEVDGTLPLLVAFLARLDAHIISIEMDGPWNGPAPAAGAASAPPRSAGGAPTQAPAARVPGVTVTFVAAGSARVQTLSYIRVQMQDAELSKKTDLLAFLKSAAPFTSFVKSASYLMHDDRFSRVRSILLDDSRSILQDDTGIPFRFFGAAAWDMKLYGMYTAPVKDFGYGFQKDLDEAFKRPGAARPLPFSFGYHWRTGTSSVMLATRKPATD